MNSQHSLLKGLVMATALSVGVAYADETTTTSTVLPVVGTWSVVLNLQNSLTGKTYPVPTFVTVHPDGSTTSNSVFDQGYNPVGISVGSGSGVWKKVGPCKYKFVFYLFAFDPNTKKPLGYVKSTTADITLDKTGTQMSIGAMNAQLYNLDDKSVCHNLPLPSVAIQKSSGVKLPTDF